jgi:glycosyltransferase involved in cell wall biosynthesis
LKVLFIHEVSWRKKVVYEIHDFPELLSLRGHDVSFLEYDEDEGQLSTQPNQLTKNLIQSTSVMVRAHSNSYVRVITPRRFFPGMFGRFLAVLIHPFIIWNEIRNNRPNVVVLYGIPTNGWQTVMICKCLKVPVLLRAIDVSHQLRKTNLGKLIRISEKFVYRNVNHISTNNPALADYIALTSKTKSTIDVLLPGVDLDKFKPADKPVELMNKYKIDELDRVIIFMGTLFRFSGLYELIQSAAGILSGGSRIKMMIIGDGEDSHRINQKISDLSLEEKVICVGRVEYDDLPRYLQLGDVAVLPFLQQDVTEFAFPGKVLQYLSTGIPTVSIHLKGLERTFPKDSGFVFVNTAEEMVFRCDEIINDPDLRASLSIQGRSQMEEMCNWVTQVEKFVDLLEEVTLTADDVSQ